ncbi:RNA polymerase sigma factor [Portibacter marinus]|uniref:RNA polymerase sigma factor n=1 Tax=Portibacter marinus TaxID=2898660 RepID=UPI001F42FC2D|nr:sigma-70 family RNA polymerase sigma factor [Portibacter marinus]
MTSDKIIDHLFRHEYGKMVSSLTRIYGIQNLELIEDAVQDTFKKAVLYFRNHSLPDNLQAWLRTAVKNRAIDLFRKAATHKKYDQASGPGFMSMSEVFSDHEIEDNQLRLLFTICHPGLKTKDQIIFALKSFSGFSITEIAGALLLDKENVKKTLQRARKKLQRDPIAFQVPTGAAFNERIDVVHLAIYLLFNEGFHSSGKDSLIRKDLVAEALRLGGLLLDKFKEHETSALMALMCFHAARLNAKIDDEGNLIKLKYQDRKRWNYQLVWKGHLHMEHAVETKIFTRFHYEAAIAGEYVMAENFDQINWRKLENYYTHLIRIHSTPLNILNLAVIQHQSMESDKALKTISKIQPFQLKGKEHLYHAVLAEIQMALQNYEAAQAEIEHALALVQNQSERKLLTENYENIKSGIVTK